MTTPLQTYLADHLAGATHAIELLNHLHKELAEREMGQFAGQLVGEIEADRQTLEEIAQRFGSGSSELKDLGGWLSEKLSRLKLTHHGEDSLDTFEAFEHLALGIQGKYALWRVLESIAQSDPELRGIDFASLQRRALDQHTRVEKYRIELAPKALRVKAASSK